MQKKLLALCLIFMNHCFAQQNTTSPKTDLCLVNQEILESLLLEDNNKLKHQTTAEFLKKYSWLLRPYLTLVVTLSGLALYEAIRPFIINRPLVMPHPPLVPGLAAYLPVNAEKKSILEVLLFLASTPLYYGFSEKIYAVFSEKLRGNKQAITQAMMKEKEKWLYLHNTYMSDLQHANDKSGVLPRRKILVKKYAWILTPYVSIVLTLALISFIFDGRLYKDSWLDQHILKNSHLDALLFLALFPLIFSRIEKTCAELYLNILDPDLDAQNEALLRKIASEWNKNFDNIPTALQPSIKKLYADLINKNIEPQATYETISALCNRIPRYIQ